MRHPGLFRKWLPFGGKLLAGKIPPRDRELLILRTGWRCGAEYEWGQHAVIGRAAGLTDDEIRRVQDGPDAPGWSAADATLLRAADELHDDSCITDATWDALAARYDERQLIELPDARRSLPPGRLRAELARRAARARRPRVRRVSEPRLAGRRVLVVGAGTQPSDEADAPVGNGTGDRGARRA